MKPKYGAGQSFVKEFEGSVFVYSVEAASTFPIGDNGRFEYFVRTYVKNKSNNESELYYCVLNEKSLDEMKLEGGEI